MLVYPAVHYSMGGLWVDYDQMTNIPGLFAVGEVDYQYHGANRLGANSLISCIYGGMVTGPKMVTYPHSDAYASSGKAPPTGYEREMVRLQNENDAIAQKKSHENP